MKKNDQKNSRLSSLLPSLREPVQATCRGELLRGDRESGRLVVRTGLQAGITTIQS